jgi:ABC-2 type transport system ATP-binding protein
VIRVEALTKRWGDHLAVDRLDLDVAAGTIFGFLGRNGAGKTTTIKMMMGLLEPTAGRVRLGGHDVARTPEAAKAVTGYVPDRPWLHEKLTGREHLAFVGGLFGLDARTAATRADALLDDLALAAQADDLIETWSHGMKQRLALAGALVHRPRILVLDEPMVGLDPEGARDLRRRLRALAADGVAVFLSTHSLPVAEDVADRIGIVDRGRLVALGTLAELRAQAGGAGASLEEIFLDVLGVGATT